MKNKFFAFVAAITLAFAGTATAICPGYNFGIADTGPSPEDPELGTCTLLTQPFLAPAPDTETDSPHRGSVRRLL